jgi:glycosyltransferase involved in cell wall biosynthesis
LSIGNWEFKISVVIAARNEADLPNTIDSIRENTDGPLEFIVVDDASDSPVPGARVRHATPRGAGYSKNHGARLATGGYLFFPDAHMRFEKGTLRRLVETAREKNGIAYCGCNGHFACRLESDDYGLFEPKWYTPEAKSGVIETTAIMGASTVISRANLERIGGWPAFPGRLGFEELALSIMARRCGLRFWSDMDISSRHQFREEKDLPYRPSQTGWHLNRVCAFRTLFEDETYKALWRPRLIESGIPEWIVESADAPEILEYGQQLRSRFVMSDSEFISFLRSQPCR